MNTTERYRSVPQYREKLRSYQNNRNKHNRLVLFELLGGSRCVRCGYSDIRALQLDHINGAKEDINRFPANPTRTNRSVRVLGTVMMIRYYVTHPQEAREKLRVLCANCNWKRRYEHKQGRPVIID